MTTTQTKPAVRSQSPVESANPSKPAWYELAAEAVFSQLEATPAGLTSDEARRRIAQYGYNELTAKKRSAFIRFMLQFHNAMIYILLAPLVALFSIRLPLEPVGALGHGPDGGESIAHRLCALPANGFRTAAFPVEWWLIIGLGLFPGFTAVELEKFIRRRFAATT